MQGVLDDTSSELGSGADHRAAAIWGDMPQAAARGRMRIVWHERRAHMADTGPSTH